MISREVSFLSWGTISGCIISSTNFNAQFNNNMYVTLLSSTCFGPWRAHPQEGQLHKHSIWYPRSPKRLYTTPVESRLQSTVLWCTVEKTSKYKGAIYKIFVTVVRIKTATQTKLHKPLIYIYIYIYICVCVCVCIYIYIYIYIKAQNDKIHYFSNSCILRICIFFTLIKLVVCDGDVVKHRLKYILWTFLTLERRDTV